MRHKTTLEIADEIIANKKKWRRVMLLVFLILFFATLIFAMGFYTKSISFNFSKTENQAGSK